MHFVRDEHKSNLIVFLVRIFRKKNVWIGTQCIRGAVHVMKRSLHLVVCREESRSLSLSLFSVHSIPWRECPPTFFGDVMDETHLEEDITSFSWSSILLPGNR